MYSPYKIRIQQEPFATIECGFDGEFYEVDVSRKMEPYTPGDLIAYVDPFFGIPLRLYFAIRSNGTMAFRAWEISNGQCTYVHTTETQDHFTATPEQIDTVNGLFSRRLTFEGLYLAPGKTLQDICPIDVAREESITGEKIYLA